MNNKSLKFKCEAYEDIDFVPYKKASKKTPPRKSKHKHIYEPVILSYFNRNKSFDRNKGFIGGMDTCGGRRCTVCGHLATGFPDNFNAAPNQSFFWEFNDLRINFPNLPIVEVDDIFNLF